MREEISKQIKEIKSVIQDADQVLIGIGEVWNLFKKGDSEDGLEADYLGVLNLEKNSEEKRRILKAYEVLYDLVKDKPHFMVTMNADDVIYESSFEREQIVAPCGSVHMLQCHQHILEPFETEPIFKEIKEHTLKDFPPKCPVCHMLLKLNTIQTKGYLEDAYLPQWKIYTEWLTRTLNEKLCVLELGVSFAHPSVIRFPFEKTVFYNKKATMVRVNDKFPQLPEDLKEKGIAVQADAIDFILELKEA